MPKGKLLGYVVAGVVGGLTLGMVQWTQVAYATKFPKDSRGPVVSSDFVLTDKDGNSLAEWKVAADGKPVFYMRPKDSQMGAIIYFRNGGPAIELEDANGIGRIAISLTDVLQGPSIVVADDKGRIRSSLGRIKVTSTKGKSDLTDESSLYLFGADTNVLWKAPPEFEMTGRASISKSK